MIKDYEQLALDTIKNGKQAIVFMASRASTEKSAESIAKKREVSLEELGKEILKGSGSPTKQCKKLAKCVEKGIAFHHSGLTSKQKDVIEEAFKRGEVSVICCTPTLCLSENTKIWQPQGHTLVKNIGTSVLFALSQSNKLQVMKAKNVIKNRNFQRLIEITSVSGHSIRLTPNHRILIRKNNKKQLITAKKCKVKDKIATVGKLSINKIKTPRLGDFVIDNELPLPNRELKESDFYFIGSMLGDGYSGSETRNNHIHYKGSPTFTSGDLESIELVEIISKSFDHFSKRKKRLGSISLILTKKKWFREFLCRSGVEIGKNKYVSPLLMQADLNLVKYLLRGLFDTDGCVERNRNVSFSNISSKLIGDIQRLLLRFGIVSRLRKRKGSILNITGKDYFTKDSFEIVIAQNRSIYLFHEKIGFNLKRKRESLAKLVTKISLILYSECKECKYKVYADVFSGRTQEQKNWGLKKKKVIELLGKEGEIGSREIRKRLNFLPRHPKGNRLNHHYEFITKRRMGCRSDTEWFWSLNLIGSWVYWRILNQDKEVVDFFKLSECPICKNRLIKKLKKKWRDSDFDGDIFWDYVRSVKEVEVEKDVYDVTLPDVPDNDHMFVANGFIVHNSAGLSLPVFRVIISSLKRYSGKWGMDWIPVLEYLQMAGRAGRPEYETFGEAIVVAGTDVQKEEIFEKYICGEPEDIYSKLAVEPVLRTYLLSLISSGIIKDNKSMHGFFAKTFWAQQFGDMDKLSGIMERMLGLLEDWGFIVVQGGEDKEGKGIIGNFVAAIDIGKEREKKMQATAIGRRISELYLDPLTARHLLSCLEKFDEKKNEFSLLQMISHTLEMRPLLRLKSKEQEMVQEVLVEKYNQLLENEPDVFDMEYNEFLNSLKTALFFCDWIDENDEQFLLDKFGIRPGEVRYKLEAADWLLYASEELAKLQRWRAVEKRLRVLRVRVKNGVKEELLALLKIKGIGRIRARKLYLAGVRDLGDLQKIDNTSLGQLLGKGIAGNVKEQMGQEIEVVAAGKRKGQLSLDKFSRG